jgi:hypothetical protein
MLGTSGVGLIPYLLPIALYYCAISYLMQVTFKDKMRRRDIIFDFFIRLHSRDFLSSAFWSEVKEFTFLTPSYA